MKEYDKKGFKGNRGMGHKCHLIIYKMAKCCEINAQFAKYLFVLKALRIKED